MVVYYRLDVLHVAITDFNVISVGYVVKGFLGKGYLSFVRKISLFLLGHYYCIGWGGGGLNHKTFRQRSSFVRGEW